MAAEQAEGADSLNGEKSPLQERRRLNYVEVSQYTSNTWIDDAIALSFLRPLAISFGGAT